MQAAALSSEPSSPLDPELQQAIENLRPLAADRLAPSETRGARHGPAVFLVLSVLSHVALIALAILVPTELPAAVVELPAIEVEMIAAAPEPTESKGRQAPEFAIPVVSTPAPAEPQTEAAPIAPHTPIPEAETPATPTERLPPSETLSQAEPLNLEKQKASTSPPDTSPVVTPVPEMQVPILHAPPTEEIIRPAAEAPPVFAAKPVETSLEEPALQNREPVKPEKPRRPERVKRSPKIAEQASAQKPENEKRKPQEVSRPSQRSSAQFDRIAAPGAAANSVSARNAYAAIISAEINAHKFYPAAARDKGVSGVVGVTFTVGRNGRAGGVSITRSSGNAVLDEAARQAVFSVRAPPPPEGHFIGSTSLRFSLQ